MDTSLDRSFGPWASTGRITSTVNARYQHILDKATPLVGLRWCLWVLVFFLYGVRVWYLRGFYIVTYGLGIFNLNLVIGFLSPQLDPETEGPALPTKGDQEFKPFVRRLPEFKFWLASIKAFCTAFCLTFFSVFDVPVFWPILLVYWLVLFMVTMKRQIRHMIKYRYLPFSFVKQTYGAAGAKGKGAADK